MSVLPTSQIQDAYAGEGHRAWEIFIDKKSEGASASLFPS